MFIGFNILFISAIGKSHIGATLRPTYINYKVTGISYSYSYNNFRVIRLDNLLCRLKMINMRQKQDS